MALQNIVVELTEMKDTYIQQVEALMKEVKHISMRMKTISGTIEEINLSKLKSLPFVKRVILDKEFKIQSPMFFEAPEKPADFLTMAGKFITTGSALDLMNGHNVNGGKGIKIAILDTGVNSRHELLKGKVIKNIQVSKGNINDKIGHGTWITGAIVASRKQMNLGEIRGIAPNSKIINVKILDDNGTGSTSTIIEGIDKALDEGVKVINMSLASPIPCDPIMSKAMQTIIEEGAIPVCAGGNFGNNAKVGCPASNNNTIAVGSVYPHENKVKLSTFSPKGVDVSAIGGNINPSVYVVSTVGATYKGMAGTSMAAPFVTGLIALLLEQNPYLTYNQILSIIANTSSNKGKKDIYTGYGLIDINKAIQYAKQGKSEPIEPKKPEVTQPNYALPLLFALGYILTRWNYEINLLWKTNSRIRIQYNSL